VPAQATAQLSYSGTPRSRTNQTRPDEYVRDLADPIKRMEIFDEMRSSDEAINTAISAREQMIGSSNWLLSSSDDTPKGKEILEFCEDNVYPVLPELLRHLSGAIQYGFGACEKVFEWSDRPFARNIVRGKVRRATKSIGRRIYLRKAAHIRQRTIFSFIVPQTGDLEFVRQYVYTGTGFAKTDIPAEKLLIWTFNRRGDDYWGYPPARNCYRAWKFKQQLEKLNLLGMDRFGVGTPVYKYGEGTTDVDRKRIDDFMAAWRAGQNTFISHPSNSEVTIESADGRLVLSVLEWVKFYNVGIAKSFLTQVSELGTTDTGSRAVGQTFTEQLEGVVQSDCEDIANILNEQLIIDLVDWNYGPQETYPIFAPSARLQIDTATAQLINTLKQSGAGAHGHT
jgi:phage gp29-like protein